MSDPTKRPERLALAALFLTAVFSVLTYLLGYSWSGSFAIMAIAVPLSLAKLFSFIAWWHANLVRKEQAESEEQDRISNQYERDDLFGDDNDALKMAADAHRSFDKWFLTIFTLVLGLLVVIYSVMQWRGWSGLGDTHTTRNAMQAAGISFFMMIFTLLGGSYYNGLSRERGCRFLRPIAQWLIFSSLIYLAAFVAMLLENYSVGHYDSFVGLSALVLIGIFGIELVLNFIIEFYRPRGIGEAERPLYESRLLALFTEPGGLAKNVAHSLDYQFGFKVSETWFYAFIEKMVIPFCIITVLTLYILTCFSKIEAGEKGIRERFGNPQEAILTPGLHFKLPWPAETIRKIPVSEIQKVAVGFQEYQHGEAREPDPNNPNPEETMDQTEGRVLVWDKHHFKEETPFLVATVEQDKGTTDENSTGLVPVNFLTSGIIVYYKVKDEGTGVLDYAYNYSNPAKLLSQVAYRETTQYYASVDFIKVLGEDHAKSRDELEARIKAAVAGFSPSLGIDVLYVANIGSHPPVEVAPDFQKVVGAYEESRTTVLQAERDAGQITALVIGEAASITEEAHAYKATASTVSASEAQQIAAQYKAYEIQPQVFMMRAYLDMMEEVTQGVRKFIVTADQAKKITTLDLKEKLRPDIGDVDLNASEY